MPLALGITCQPNLVTWAWIFRRLRSTVSTRWRFSGQDGRARPVMAKRKAVHFWTVIIVGGCLVLSPCKFKLSAVVWNVCERNSSLVSPRFVVGSLCYWTIIVVLVLQCPTVNSISFVNVSQCLARVKRIEYFICSVRFQHFTSFSVYHAASSGAACLCTSCKRHLVPVCSRLLLGLVSMNRYSGSFFVLVPSKITVSFACNYRQK